MATIMTHALVPLAVAAIAGRQHVSPKLCFWAVIASLLPDADVVAFKLGIAYEHILGHRGFTHSLGFALAVGLMASFFCRLPAGPALGGMRVDDDQLPVAPAVGRANRWRPGCCVVVAN